MNAWLWAATALLVALLPLAPVLLRSSPLDALVALQAASAVVTLALLALAEGFGRSSYYVLALVVPPLSFAGSLVFLRLFERE